MQLASKQLDDEGMRTAKLGALCALVPSIMQLFVGFWLTIVFPNSRSVLGGNLWATGGLMISVLLALQLLSELGGVVFGEISTRSIRKCSHLMMAIVTVMTWTLVLIQN